MYILHSPSNMQTAVSHSTAKADVLSFDESGPALIVRKSPVDCIGTTFHSTNSYTATVWETSLQTIQQKKNSPATSSLRPAPRERVPSVPLLQYSVIFICLFENNEAVTEKTSKKKKTHTNCETCRQNASRQS